MDKFVFSHRVYYNETDQMGRVYHSNFLIWMERARTEWIRSTGVSYKEIEDMGFMLPVSSVEVKYLNGVGYDTLVNIVVEVEEFSRIRLKFSYEFYDEKYVAKYGNGTTSHIFTDKSGKPKRIPEKLYEKIKGGFKWKI